MNNSYSFMNKQYFSYPESYLKIPHQITHLNNCITIYIPEHCSHLPLTLLTTKPPHHYLNLTMQSKNHFQNNKKNADMLFCYKTLGCG